MEKYNKIINILKDANINYKIENNYLIVYDFNGNINNYISFYKCNGDKTIKLKDNQNIELSDLILFKTKGIIIEDFIQYKKPTLFVSNTLCKDFKCDYENKCKLCINSQLVNQKDQYISLNSLIKLYISNDITEGITFGGLENFDQFFQLYYFIKEFRKVCNDVIIIYTGYYKNEIEDKIQLLSKFENIIIKYGRFKPNQTKVYDNILGVYLSNKEQYAEYIS